MAASGKINDFEEFWLYYLREHADPRTRGLHYFGTSIAVLGVAACIVLGRPWFLVAVPVAGYGPAWFAHFVIEKNTPATFRYPLWSLASDFRMAFAWVTGQIALELKRAGVVAPKR